MEQILHQYFDEKLSLHDFENWFNGSKSMIDDSLNVDDLNSQNFITNFIESLHSSLDWLLKQDNKAIINNNSTILSDSLNIDNEDIFPSLEQQQPQPTKKRIKPTKIVNNETNIVQNDNFLENSSLKNEKILSIDFLKEERELWKQFRKNNRVYKNFKNYSNDNNNIESNTNIQKNFNSTVIEPKFDKVYESNGHTKIEKLQKLYQLILVNNFWPYLFEEIRFIIEVISKKSVVDSSIISNDFAEDQISILSKLFNSYHNCFYFGWLVFCEIIVQKKFIVCFNENVIHHLLDNQFLYKFKESSSSSIKTILNENLMQIKFSSISLASSSPANNDISFVSFKLETDGKQNFSDNHSFSSFRRQRDEFYRLYRQYNENSWSALISTDISIRLSFTNNIQNIFMINKDLSNSYHLARLFINQLIKSCSNRCATNNFGTKILNGLSSNDQVKINQDRLNKLQNRITQRERHQTNNNNNSLLNDENLFNENFGKNELFFRDFIFYSDQHSFNEQLKMIIKTKLLELMTNLTNNPNNYANKENLFNFLIHSSLLAKFAGFLSFYPFETRKKIDVNLNQTFIDKQKNLRQINNYSSGLMFNFETFLLNSMENFSLFIVLPWIIEFLLFMDQISLQMNCFTDIFSLLTLIYKFYLPNLDSYSTTIESIINIRIFLQLYLEKLFIYKKINVSSYLSTIIENNRRNSEDITDKLFSKFNESKIYAYFDFNLSKYIDSNIILYFFPQFSRQILDVMRNSCRNEIRKIKPTTLMIKSDDENKMMSQNSASNIINKLQFQIENHFYNIHSDSLRKCINFVNDNIKENCIQKLKNEIILSSIQKHSDHMKMNDQVENEKVYRQIRDDCKHFIEKHSTPLIEKIYSTLIVEDDENFDDETKRFIMQQLCSKKIRQKCFEWIDLNLNDANLIKIKLSKNVRHINLNEKHFILDDSKLIMNSKQLICDIIHEKFDKSYVDSIIKIIQQFKVIKCSSNNIEMADQQIFDMIILDLLMCLLIYLPLQFNDNLLDNAIDYWTKTNVTAKYKKIICSKYFYMINRSKSPMKSWQKWETLLRRMIKLDIYNFDALEEDTIVTLKNEWPKSLLTKFASMLQSLVDFVRMNNLCDPQDIRIEIIDWLAWFCNDENDEEF